MTVDTKDRSELEPLFTPPAGLHGTHLLMCGLSADTETLERALAAFTNEAPAQRRASGLVRGWLMLDASAPHAGAQPVPGLLRLLPCLKQVWRARTTLMHAKVALMGFGASRCAAPRHWRLLVSTGNWTAPTWGGDGQIDLFWTTDWDADTPLQDEEAQALADMHAAFAFFERLLAGLYSEHWLALREEPLAGQWLATWRQLLRLRGAARTCTPKFIHSLDASMLDQVAHRFPEDGVSQLVVGSGFFEQPNDRVEGPPEVLQALEQLGRPAKRFLVFNPAQAGALAPWFDRLRTRAVSSQRLDAGQAGRWTLCLPRDPLLATARGGRRFLHAKYIAGLHAVRDGGSARLAFLYLGSGNISRRGLRSRAFLDTRGGNAQRETGNVEVGVVLRPGHRVDRIWQRLACGEVASDAAIARTTVGTASELFEPLDPPPLLLLREQANLLELVRSALPAVTLWLQHEDGPWQQVTAHEDAVAWHGPCPPSVRVRTADPATVGTATEWEVPVLTRDGLFCRRELTPLGVDGVLQALLAFPGTPPQDDDADDDGVLPADGARRALPPTRYPLRVLAALVEVIAHRNNLVTLEEFPYWLTQVRLLLLEQADDTQRLAIRALGVDLFGALLEPGFVPDWLQAHPLLLERYAHLVQALRAAWCLPRGEQL